MRKPAKVSFTPVPVLLLVLFAFSTAVSGLNNTFKVEKGYWNLSSNWSEGHTPTSGETAVIPATSTAFIPLGQRGCVAIAEPIRCIIIACAAISR